jgi:disulfide oxidoreductase YuzD
VKDLVCMNQALFLKWMWQWIDSDNAWWKEASRVPTIHIITWEITNTTKFWSDLQTLLPIFQSSVQFQLGAGTLLQFCHDSWMQQPLKIQYPHLFEQVRYTDISVSDCYQQEQWRIYVNDSLDPTAQQELQDLISKLSCVRIQHKKDQISWLRCTSGKFTVKTTYAFIHNTPHVDSRLLKIWEIKAPQRVQMFCLL